MQRLRDVAVVLSKSQRVLSLGSREGGVIPVSLTRTAPSTLLSRLLTSGTAIETASVTSISDHSLIRTEPTNLLSRPFASGTATGTPPVISIGKLQDRQVPVTNFLGENRGFAVLGGDVFDVPIRKDIVHRVVRWQLAKRRQGSANTKNIHEVSGTGRKPYNQKGTGRARHGSLRGPQFRGGATMHGPRPRSFEHKLQKNVRRLGLKMALSARAAEGKLVIFDEMRPPSEKTRDMASYISVLNPTKKILFVDGGDKADPILARASRNIHYANILPQIGLNVYSILQHDMLIMSVEAVKRVENRLRTPINRGRPIWKQPNQPQLNQA